MELLFFGAYFFYDYFCEEFYDDRVNITPYFLNKNKLKLHYYESNYYNYFLYGGMY